jgi:hypothetical protein
MRLAQRGPHELSLHNPRLIFATKSLASGGRRTPRLQEGIMVNTKLTLIAASVAVVVGLFAVKMLITPPISEAATVDSIPVEQLTLNAKNLPYFEDNYQRHLGVLDTLKQTP